MKHSSNSTCEREAAGHGVRAYVDSKLHLPRSQRRRDFDTEGVLDMRFAE